MAKKRGIRTGPHDLAFLGALGRYGMLSTNDAPLYFPGLKHNSLQRRLRLMADNGLTVMTKLEVWRADDGDQSNGGRIPTLHSLTDEGALFVESQTGECPPRVLRSRPAAMTFLHRREIVRVMRAFDTAVTSAGLEQPEWVMEQDAWPEAPKKLPPNQRRLLYHSFESGITCLPDLACRLTIGETTLALFWEIDLSTEGKKQLRKASKTDGYVSLFQSQAFQRYWPDMQTQRHYVLWVTPTQRRFSTLRDVLTGHSLAPLCRLLAAHHLDDAETLLTSAVWETIDGQRRAMYRPSSPAA